MVDQRKPLGTEFEDSTKRMYGTRSGQCKVAGGRKGTKTIRLERGKRKRKVRTKCNKSTTRDKKEIRPVREERKGTNGLKKVCLTKKGGKTKVDGERVDGREHPKKVFRSHQQLSTS